MWSYWISWRFVSTHPSMHLVSTVITSFLRTYPNSSSRSTLGSSSGSPRCECSKSSKTSSPSGITTICQSKATALRHKYFTINSRSSMRRRIFIITVLSKVKSVEFQFLATTLSSQKEFLSCVLCQPGNSWGTSSSTLLTRNATTCLLHLIIFNTFELTQLYYQMFVFIDT